ncbi:MAG: rhomboid family intramembrane serine protease [Luteolibacter sp.]|uniref:rhomboid family intramembrane serine protease n=1 Tax=Luteolibacter sp. TaxID=1962973 RepID=UPI003267FD2F
MSSFGVPFSNAARNLRQLGSSPVTWSFAVVILAIELAITLVGGRDRQPAWSWYETFGLSRDGFLAGHFWRILTYGFLHGGWWHVGLNAVFILLIGSRIEHMAGRRAEAITVLAGVIGGGIGHLVMASGLLVGISGGCMALMLLLTTLSPQSRMMPLPVSGRSLGLGIMVAALILALLDPALGIPGFSTVGSKLVDSGLGMAFKMGHACHFGGGMAGWLVGRWILRPRITLERLRRDRERREANGSQRLG